MALSAVPAHSYLLQAWSKALPANTIVDDLVVDSAGNTIVLATDRTSSPYRLYVSKVSTSGANTWAVNIIEGSASLGGHHIVVDAAGSIFIEYFNGANMMLRKLRGTDGVTVGTLTTQDHVAVLSDSASGLVVDGANNVYWVTTGADDESELLTIQVANVNTGSLPASTFRFQTIPRDASLRYYRPRPGGGVMVLAGLEASSSINEGIFNSTLYSFAPTGTPKQTAAGYATAFSTVPDSTDVVFAGSEPSSFGAFVRHRAASDGNLVAAYSGGFGTGTAFCKDIFISKSGVAFAAGGCLEDPGPYKDSLLATFSLADRLRPVKNYIVSTLGTSQQFNSVRGDNYGTVTCVEAFSSDTLRVSEVDPTSTNFIATRSYATTPGISTSAHAMNAAGFTAAGMASRIVGLKPRDLKDIYLGNTTYTGGASATAIIRMYEVHSLGRTVTLSDGGSPYVTIATSKVIAAGATQVSATVLTNPVPSTQNITLSAKYGNQTRTFAFTLIP